MLDSVRRLAHSCFFAPRQDVILQGGAMSKVEVPADVQAALKRLYHEMPAPVRVSVISTGAGGHVATWMLGTPGE